MEAEWKLRAWAISGGSTDGIPKYHCTSPASRSATAGSAGPPREPYLRFRPVNRPMRGPGSFSTQEMPRRPSIVSIIIIFRMAGLSLLSLSTPLPVSLLNQRTRAAMRSTSVQTSIHPQRPEAFPPPPPSPLLHQQNHHPTKTGPVEPMAGGRQPVSAPGGPSLGRSCETSHRGRTFLEARRTEHDAAPAPLQGRLAVEMLV